MLARALEGKRPREGKKESASESVKDILPTWVPESATVVPESETTGVDEHEDRHSIAEAAAITVDSERLSVSMPATGANQRSTTRSFPLRQAGYRPDIDGLRAFSILSVIIFHCFPRVLPSGFTGVDIFFVISGFLISGIIFKSLSVGAFSYATFYSQRIKRIFPALIIVLVATVLAGWLFLFPREWQQLGKHVFAGVAFLSNIALMREGRYFDRSLAKPLLHLWSLGIEEQFYIAWPLLLAYVWKRRSLTLPFIILVLSTSFALNLWYVGMHPFYVFYFPATRFWELAVGALLSYVTLFRSNSRLCRFSLHNPRISSSMSLAGLVLLVASLFIAKNNAYPGAWALLPTSGAFLTTARVNDFETGAHEI